ncbi:winged helix-turn-helix domain-containing protein [Yersinia enterocolitica]|uniref:Transcriptional regulator CadC n=1 Tax=Yersinia massiliensis TaxID=419257 RepID=A0ABM6UXY0_9GAMM|nr:hypothetical protein [Yersinia massiliensis]AVX39893.1 hypothetical protein DA391_20905 [Yersinia massiliensis]QKJ10622.1 hypothetical protein HRD68_07725 [Yersinia massiliensis]
MVNDQTNSCITVLCEDVIFNPLKRTLSRENNTISLSESESCLLKMLLENTCSKREVMYEIWEKRGVIVTESSYYKLVRQLRSSFKKASLDEGLITTLPRIGILYTGTKKTHIAHKATIETTQRNNTPQRSIIDKAITFGTFAIAAGFSFLYVLTVG